MKESPLILTLHAAVFGTFIWFALPACADSGTDYKAGSDFAKQVQGGGLDSLKNFNGADTLPGYTSKPEQSKYYGGVSAGGDSNLKSDSAAEWANSDVGSSITESFTNRPPDSISADAPFIQSAKETESRADSIVGNTGQACTASVVNRSEFRNHTCERDLQVEQYCTRTANISGHYKDTTTTAVYSVALKDAWQEGDQVKVRFTFGVTGTLIHAEAQYFITSLPNYAPPGQSRTLYGLGGSVHVEGGQEWKTLAGAGYQVTEGQEEIMTIQLHDKSQVSYFAGVLARNLRSGYITLNIRATMQVASKEWEPDITWVENCAFNKDEGRKTSTECIEPESTKVVWQDGKAYQVHQACWAFRDTYITQPADFGACQSLMNNAACTLSSRQCAFSGEDGTCLHEYATFSCETRTSGKQMICGGDVFCLDGECDKAASGTNNGFGQAVAELAALAAAGKDVAELNGVDVKAFTGKAKYCKKFAAGFSNCCKDSGWGQDVGLARCSSEEKALAKAKTDKLTVSIGEFCSKKVLGVCLEKKRSYCQFDSKLAQIVQQQGRNGQLHIGFGGASSPDCRAITIAEMQNINFNQLDFTNFNEDLMKNQKLPNNQDLTDKTKARIKELLTQSPAK
ncbi:type-F conjugative transfer system mating-pair stabilization protein TraN [Raoultella ornithinolytica]|uniref:type-F conjugative transfer system mating-pair stabilization protein TraN n=1 Tax=Raoultella ornithinolytica TaxID=54291 RepID=UPI002273F21E|nr:type-F conjugative transfer system mating-pair stabilization protein TraN [Raoultella ornithinolytica]EKU0199829.1 type-F conjugative transfer system mating-pair stabilization protein TraN [Raoultella ornithinolytica]EKV0508822.1 type-F conjugative transfer system mating-pair stabilization protein TraN [Raoultella ornithinolytica]EKV4103674.1 type-F conjugative transfer system mating-pair stabilization protein TraN [Raoultella ornithinolytica]EKV8287779.1 type-F conjugative transfer system m